MTYKENITAILECYFIGFKREIIESACNRILEQEPKTGEWNTFELFQSGIKETWYECPKCKWSNALLIPRNYCPNCGAKMVEPQESEDKDADKKCTYKETGCGSCKRQLDCPIEADTAESEDRCKNCEYYRNPDYTRCHECKAESEDKE